MARWGMVIDLRKCVGCQTCTVACKQAHALPAGVAWRRVADCEAGEYPDVRRLFLPLGCMHCGDPPCLPVCPTTATRKRPDGVVTIDETLCIGCGYCVVACPYRARTLIPRDGAAFDGGPTPPELKTARPERVGIATKCTFCIERLDDGRRNGLRPGVDPEATPVCVASCIAGALHFGDLDDPRSEVARLVQSHRTVRLLDELGTDPSVHYIGG